MVEALAGLASVAMVVVGFSCYLGVREWKLATVNLFVSFWSQWYLVDEVSIKGFLEIPAQNILGGAVVIHDDGFIDNVVVVVKLQTTLQSTMGFHSLGTSMVIS
jgi:hypothetical protein